MLSSPLTTNDEVDAGGGADAVVCRTADDAQCGNRKWYYGYRLSAISYRLSVVSAVRDRLELSSIGLATGAGHWPLATGYWRLATGYWLLATGGVR
jgi:hypothetical protein